MEIWVVIDEGCQECGVTSEPVGIYRTEREAIDAAEARDEHTAGWRDGGQTGARWYQFTLPSEDGARADAGEG